MTTQEDTELSKIRHKLYDHFTGGAPSYNTANEAVQANARIETNNIMPIILDNITLHTQKAVVNELKILEKSEIANISIKKMRIRISGRIAHLTNPTEAGEK